MRLGPCTCEGSLLRILLSEKLCLAAPAGSVIGPEKGGRMKTASFEIESLVSHESSWLTAAGLLDGAVWRLADLAAPAPFFAFLLGDDSAAFGAGSAPLDDPFSGLLGADGPGEATGEKDAWPAIMALRCGLEAVLGGMPGPFTCT